MPGSNLPNPPSPAGQSWRDRIKVHPAAEMPGMSDAELIELGKDIDENGLQQPLILYCERGRLSRRGLVPDAEIVVLDGVNRLTTMEKVGIELFTKDGDLCPDVRCCNRDAVKVVYGRWWDREEWVSGVEPFSYVASANVHRRHLDHQQKRKEIERLLKAQSEKSDRQIAAETKTSHPKVARVRKKLEEAGDVERRSTRTDTAGRQQPAHKLGSPAVEAIGDRGADGGVHPPHKAARRDDGRNPRDVVEAQKLLGLLHYITANAANIDLRRARRGLTKVEVDQAWFADARLHGWLRTVEAALRDGIDEIETTPQKRQPATDTGEQPAPATPTAALDPLLAIDTPTAGVTCCLQAGCRYGGCKATGRCLALRKKPSDDDIAGASKDNNAALAMLGGAR